MSNGWGTDRGPGKRLRMALAGGGAGGAVAALILAAAAGEPYLGAGGINPWLVVFAAALLCALIAMPFACEVALRARYPDRDRRWELALLAWGAGSLALLAVAVLVGPGTATLAAAAALIAAIEAGLVIATITVWLLAGG